ncbi:hypothetical protein LCGC14_2063830, partial [marine sediment metagenome]
MGNIFTRVFGTQQERNIKKLIPLVNKINGLEKKTSKLSDKVLQRKMDEFRGRVKPVGVEVGQLEKEMLELPEIEKERAKIDLQEKARQLDELLYDILPEAFAIVREAAKRAIGLRHYDEQLIGGIVLHQGKIAEMANGEGKTLAATLSACLNALSGKGVHVVTVNDYLARRDKDWMGPVYEFMGFSVGVIQNQMNSTERRQSYGCDITYGTNNEFGFDYLRDNMALSVKEQVQRGFNYTIVDEVDSILIDEARTPLIISGRAEKSTGLYSKIDRIVPRLKRGIEEDRVKRGIEEDGDDDCDYKINEKDHTVALTERGIAKAEKLLGMKDIYEPDSDGTVPATHINQAIRAHEFYESDRDYLVKKG